MNTMSENLSQYIQRSPRYILLPQDKCLIRVAGPQQTPWEEGTELRNLSNTGLCFTAPSVLLPYIGETIRVQFQVPGSQQMACFAKVVRIDSGTQKGESLVAVEFDSMNSAQQWNLLRGLIKKKVNEDSNVIELKTRQPEFSGPGLKVLFFLTVGLSLFFSSFLLIFVYRFLSDPQFLTTLGAALKMYFGKGGS